MTITIRRFKQNRKGVSNIIVVVLSLVIILAIVSNVILWSYEMNQVDWEKIKEEIRIDNVSKVVTDSSWNDVEEEFTINLGNITEGTFLNTQISDENFERFIEEYEEGASNITLIDSESFEGNWPPVSWSATNRWNKEGNYAQDGFFSADFDGGSYESGYLTSPSMDCSDADIIYIDFWWYDRGLDNDDFEIEYYDGNTWNNYLDLNQIESQNGWHHYTEALSNNQYFVQDFRIRFWAKSIFYGETGCVDFVTIKKNTNSNVYSLDFYGKFEIDLETYSLENINTIEIQTKYKASDSQEKWYLKTFNWSSSTYNDVGFNSTNGHSPTMNWDYYAVNLTDVWQNYVNENGTILVKFVDQSPDQDQTSIDIDFMGIRAILEGTQFTIENRGALTIHLVSIWINNLSEHKKYDLNVFVNSGSIKNYIRFDIMLPNEDHTVKFVTERGNIAVYSGTNN